MAVEIWDLHEKIGTFTWEGLPQPGDVIELAVAEKMNPYTVEKIISYYAIDAASPAKRIIVSYSGPGWFGVLP